MNVLSLLGGIRKMLVEPNRFHSEPVQVLNSTSENPSRMIATVQIPQRPPVPNRGAAVENSTRNSSAQRVLVGLAPLTELVLVSIFLISLFLVGCSPRYRHANLGPPEVPPLVVISGSSTISGDLVVETERNGSAEESGSTADSAVESVAESVGGAESSNSDRFTFQERLISFSQASPVQERIRRVMGWLEFGRSQVVLPRLNSGTARIAEKKITHSESALRALFSQNQELALWRELLVDPEFEAKQNAEDLILMKRRLDKAALLLLAADKPEDVQELDLVLTNN